MNQVIKPELGAVVDYKAYSSKSGEEVISLLQGGLTLEEAANKVEGITANTIQYWINTEEVFREAVESLREHQHIKLSDQMVDVAEETSKRIEEILNTVNPDEAKTHIDAIEKAAKIRISAYEKKIKVLENKKYQRSLTTPVINITPIIVGAQSGYQEDYKPKFPLDPNSDIAQSKTETRIVEIE